MIGRYLPIAEDIEYLRAEWTSSVSEASLRRGSVILRQFVVEETLGQAWRKLGFSAEPTIPATNLDEVIQTARGPVLLAPRWRW